MDLIASLTSDLKPVRRLPSPLVLSLVWVIASMAFVALGTAALEPRPESLARVLQPSFLLDASLLCVVSAAAARSAFRSSVPGLDSRARWPVVALIVLALAVAARAAAEPSPDVSMRCLRCVLATCLLSCVPGLLSFVMLRRAAALEPRRTGFASVLSATALATLGTELLCRRTDPLHALMFHVAPLAVCSALGACIGGGWLRASRRA